MAERRQNDSLPTQLPTKVDVDLLHGELRRYWLDRVRQHTHDTYAGLPMSKFPEDLRVYEHMLWHQAPDTVIELGTQFGGSALWFCDRLMALAGHNRLTRQPQVITVDTDQLLARHWLVDRMLPPGMTLIDGSLDDPQVVERVAHLAGPNCMVVEDSAHTYETTKAALDNYARFVPPGGFMVVEDGHVDINELRLEDTWPHGVLPALRDWLASPAGAEFVVRRDLELYGVTCHPSGFLQRRPE
jgi:cephalosporin hydroxylase